MRSKVLLFCQNLIKRCGFGEVIAGKTDVAYNIFSSMGAQERC